MVNQHGMNARSFVWRGLLVLVVLAAFVGLKNAGAAEIIELTQTGCQFVEIEGVDHGYKPTKKADCDAINARTAKDRLAKAELVAVLERLFSEPNIRFEDDQVVWRALQAYRGAASAGEAGLAKDAGFADALIVYKALRAASDAGEALNAVYTFDAAMQRFPHTASL